MYVSVYVAAFLLVGSFSLVVKPVDQSHRKISDTERILSPAVFGSNAVTGGRPWACFTVQRKDHHFWSRS